LTSPFEKNRLYHRQNEIHAKYRGQEQGGIITPKNFPFVIIITGEEGQQHGYADRLRDDGVFEYFGEGQVGPMKMIRGNEAVAAHSSDGKSLYLFRKEKGGLRYLGEMVCEGYHTRQAPDREKNMREAFVFELRPLDSVDAVVESAPATKLPLDELRKRAYDAAKDVVNKGSRPKNVYERSRDVRDYVLARADGKCEGCGSDAPFLRPNGDPYLEPHHIRRVSDGGPDNPKFVIALCPICHRRVHYGEDGPAYNQTLLSKMKCIEP
jgi:5-methylcytosine-specific restriction protein A